MLDQVATLLFGTIFGMMLSLGIILCGKVYDEWRAMSGQLYAVERVGQQLKRDNRVAAGALTTYLVLGTMASLFALHKSREESTPHTGVDRPICQDE